ncbi:type I restriction enzyme endonuclease domain-containing protein [Pseudomonas sp. MPB03]|uniref:type I restriction enzyme endonuclease domain-containing protein n=1 Tax=Pseudomonas sp. MPB03 TaxID=3388489 RepID=UPI003984802D
MRELGADLLVKIVHGLTVSLRGNASVGWSGRESVKVKLRILVRRILIRDIRRKLHDNPLSSHKGNPSYGTDRQHQYPAW